MTGQTPAETLRELDVGDLVEVPGPLRGIAPDRKICLLVETKKKNDAGKDVLGARLFYFGIDLGLFTAVVNKEGKTAWVANSAT